MGRANDGLASHIAFGDYHLLGQEHLTSGDLNTQITSGDHDTIGHSKNLVKVLKALFIFNLDDDFYIGTFRAKDFTDFFDVLSASDEGREDHIDAILNTELEILLVLFAEGWKIDRSFGKVNTLARREIPVINGADFDRGAIDGEDEERKNAIVDIDELAGGSYFWKVSL